MENDDLDLDVLAESENFAVWRSEEEAGFIFHLELGGITLHFASEEWQEVLALIKSLA